MPKADSCTAANRRVIDRLETQSKALSFAARVKLAAKPPLTQQYGALQIIPHASLRVKHSKLRHLDLRS